MLIVRCPTCGNEFDSATTAAMPFCSDRCRLVDLGRWLNEEQGLPVEPEDKDEPDPPKQKSGCSFNA